MLRLRGRPLVTVSYAQSLDGSIARERGRPAALSGAESLRITHRLRGAHSAILVGIGTVLSDDPLLTARDVALPSPQPVVLDTTLRTPPDSRLLRENPRPPWILAAHGADPDRRRDLEARGAVVFELGRGADGLLDPSQVLELLARHGVPSLMVEGGARVITSFLERSLVDRVAVTIVPQYLGGYRGLGDLAGRPGPIRLRDTRMLSAGHDYVLFGTVSE